MARYYKVHFRFSNDIMLPGPLLHAENYGMHVAMFHGPLLK